jgi:ATP-dependent 26S proteasome regulatory subunit
LAQRLAVRLQHKYKKSILVEVNSHSLFSKWFSESGKFVQKLFEQIVDLACNTNWLIFVLIDEVESLVMERTAHQGSDPSDSVRVLMFFLQYLNTLLGGKCCLNPNRQTTSLA